MNIKIKEKSYNLNLKYISATLISLLLIISALINLFIQPEQSGTTLTNNQNKSTNQKNTINNIPSINNNNNMQNNISPKNPSPINNNGDEIISLNDDFEINYYKSSDTYHLFIKNPDFKKGLLNAENNFLEIMNLSLEEACKLKVYSSTTIYINSEYAGKKYGLSFCSEQDL